MGMALGLWSTGLIYSPRHPGADCLGGPCQGQPSSFLVQPACSLWGGMEGCISWSGQAAGPQPEDLCQLSYPGEATATTHEQGTQSFSRQGLTFNS